MISRIVPSTRSSISPDNAPGIGSGGVEVAVAVEQSERAGTLDDLVIARFGDRCALEVRQQRTGKIAGTGPWVTTTPSAVMSA